MAGSYPDVPGYRFAYDLDGTAGFVFRSGSLTNLTSANLAYLNNSPGGSFGDANIIGTAGVRYFGFIFPELRSITGLWMMADRGQEQSGFVPTLHWSTDTTNGMDGVWTTGPSGFGTIFEPHQAISPYYRTDIATANLPSVRAVRFTASRDPYWVVACHLYGTIAATNSPDRLRVVDVDSNDIAAQLDYGNIAQRASATKQFKVINNSATQTANNITVSLGATIDASPSIIGQYQISTDNVGFANAINIGTLAPGAESSTLYVRMNPAANAQLGPWSARIIAHPTSWS